MYKKRWSVEIKDRAKLLRLQGYTYGQLVKQLGVPKSTIHVWIRGTKRPGKFSKLDRIHFLREIQPLGAQANRAKREKYLLELKEKLKKEISLTNLNIDNKKALLSTLYLAEGSKVRGAVQFTNTDPRLTLLFIKLLRDCYKLDEKKFRIGLHLHYYHKIKEVRKFWSELLGIPISQFHKVHIKQRSKKKRFRKNFIGICLLRYSSVYLKEELVHYGYLLIEKMVGKVKVPVA